MKKTRSKPSYFTKISAIPIQATELRTHSNTSDALLKER